MIEWDGNVREDLEDIITGNTQNRPSLKIQIKKYFKNRYMQGKRWVMLGFPTIIKIFQLIGLSFKYLVEFLKLYPLYIYYKYFKYGIFPIFYKPSMAFKYIHFFKVFRPIFKLSPAPRNDWLFYTHSNIYFFKIDWNSLSNMRQAAILISLSSPAKKRFKDELIQDFKKFLHREDGPAKISKTYCKTWAINGKYHREDGPAIDCPSRGYKQYLINGKLHREDGPAVVYTADIKKQYYWLDGKHLNEREFISKTFKLNVAFD